MHQQAYSTDFTAQWIGNGKCDDHNNVAKCNFDGGDCCAKTCYINCNASASLIPCTYACGSNGYRCLEQNVGCYACKGGSGQCNTNMTLCLKGEISSPNSYVYDMVLLLMISCQIEICKINPLSMGNYRTINKYCGLDPYFNVTHDPLNPTLHFFGCGLYPEQAYLLNASGNALLFLAATMSSQSLNFNRHQRYDFTAKTCDSSQKNYTFFDPVSYSNTSMIVSCISHLTQCFVTNMQARGQCCQCNSGWTSYDCGTPVCSPPCVNGQCVGPNNCSCNTGWAGKICTLGICNQGCIKGVCIAPGDCRCFYGYTGFDCGTPISHPECVNGQANNVDSCQCNSGWTGRICDVPACKYDCGNGYCADVNECECMPGYTSSSTLTPCDTLNPLMADLNCFTVSGSLCTACRLGYYLTSLTAPQQCSKNLMIQQYLESCIETYSEPLCLECNNLQCLACQWPYQIDPSTLKCQSQGLIEFAYPRFEVIETQSSFAITLRRTFGSVGSVSVDYDMTQSSPYFTRLEQTTGTIIFASGVTELTIPIQLYKRQYYESLDGLTTFVLNLYNPQNGAEIGYQDNVVIYYYDDAINMNDAKYSYSTINGSVNTGAALNVKIGYKNTFVVNCFNGPALPKTLGNDLFIIKVIINGVVDAYQLIPIYTSSNQYTIDITIKHLNETLIRAYACAYPGFTISYFSNTRFAAPVYIQRIENYLPTTFSAAINKLSFFSMRIECNLLFKYALTPTTRDVQFQITVADQGQVLVYLGSTLVLDSGKFNCFGSFFTASETCCLQTQSFTLSAADMTGLTSYYLRIDFRHLSKNKPCIRVYRQPVVPLTGFTLARLNTDAYSLTELSDSPFIINPLLSPELLSLTATSYHIVRFIDTNTGSLIPVNSMQATMPNMIVIDPKDLYGNNLQVSIFTLQFDVTLIDGSTTLTGNQI